MPQLESLVEKLFVQTLSLDAALAENAFDEVRSLLDERDYTLTELEKLNDPQTAESLQKISVLENRLVEKLNARRTVMSSQLAEAFRASVGEREYRRAA